MEQNQNSKTSGSRLGSAFSIAAGISFYVLCMIFPLVGPSGSRVPHAMQNKLTFFAVLVLTLMLAGAAMYVSLQHRREQGGSLSRFPAILSAVCLLIFIIALFNGFAI